MKAIFVLYSSSNNIVTIVFQFLVKNILPLPLRFSNTASYFDIVELKTFQKDSKNTFVLKEQDVNILPWQIQKMMIPFSVTLQNIDH